MIREIKRDYHDGEVWVNEYAGLSTDTKPTDGIATGAIFVEVDTGNVFFFNENGKTWVEQFSFQS